MTINQIKIITLALRICGDIRSTFPSTFRDEIVKSLEQWISWSELYQALLSQGRIWDFRDIFLAAIRCFGLPQSCQKFFLTESWRERILDDWILYERDESTALAQLDILVGISLYLESLALDRVDMDWLQIDAQKLVEEIMEKHPQSMKSRTFTRWILMKAAGVGVELENDLGTGLQKPFEYLNNYPGLIFAPRWPSLPIYIPREFETPVWLPPEVSPEKEAPIQMALNLATQLKDYRTQALCLKMLILRSQDPTSLFEQLKHLQKHTQGDNEEYLHTCLASYLICKEKPAQQQLLVELQNVENWTESWLLRNPQLYFAEHFIERILTAKLSNQPGPPPLRLSTMKYYPWLGDKARGFIDSFSPVRNPSQVPPPGYRPVTSVNQAHEGEYFRGNPGIVPAMDPIVSAYEAGKQDARAEYARRFQSHAPPQPAIIEHTIGRPPQVRGRDTAAMPPPQDREGESTIVEHDATASSSEDWESVSTSDDSSSSGDCKITFSNGNEVRIPKKDIEGKQVTISFRDKKKQEYARVRRARDGDYIYTTTEKSSKDKKGKGVARDELRTARERISRVPIVSTTRTPSVVRVRGEDVGW